MTNKFLNKLSINKCSLIVHWVSIIYQVLGEVLELYHILLLLKENNRLSSCQMHDNRCELKNPADLLSGKKKKKNTSKPSLTWYPYLIEPIN